MIRSEVIATKISTEKAKRLARIAETVSPIVALIMFAGFVGSIGYALADEQGVIIKDPNGNRILSTQPIEDFADSLEQARNELADTVLFATDQIIQYGTPNRKR